MYNNFILAHMLIMPTACIFLLIVGPPRERRLLKHIDDAISAATSINTNKLQEFKQRLIQSFSEGRRSILFTGGSSLPGAIIFLTLGSVPFQWVVMLFIFHGITLFGSLGLLKLLDKPVADGGLKASSSVAAAGVVSTTPSNL